MSGLDETNCVDVLNHEVLRKYPSFEALGVVFWEKCECAFFFFCKGWGWLNGLVDPVSTVGSSRLPLGCIASHLVGDAD